MACYGMHAAAEEAKPGLSGEAQLGVVLTSGNSETQSVNGKLSARYLTGPWRHTGRLEALRASDAGTTTAERYLASFKSDYRYSPHEYLFGALRYEDDRFSGYDYQFSEVLGYGRRVVARPTLSLDLEGGIGGRHSKPSGGTRKDEAVARLAGELDWQVGPTAGFIQNVLVESGASNTYAQSVSALKMKINGNFSMKASYTVSHNTDVPAGTKNTDTLTSVTLVYDF